MPRHPIFVFVFMTLMGGAMHAAPLTAQQGPPTIPGFTPAAAAAERVLEAQAIARPQAMRARELSRALSAETHVAGTPAQARTRDFVIAQMRARREAASR